MENHYAPAQAEKMAAYVSAAYWMIDPANSDVRFHSLSSTLHILDTAQYKDVPRSYRSRAARCVDVKHEGTVTEFGRASVGNAGQPLSIIHLPPNKDVQEFMQRYV